MEQFDHRSISMPTNRSRVWLPCAIAVVAVTAGGLMLLGLRVANQGREPAGQNWWLVTWFCVGLTYSVVGAALVARSSRRRLGVCFLVVGASAVVSALAIEYRSLRVERRIAVRFPAFAEAWMWARPLGEAVLVTFVTWELLPPAWRADRRSRYAFRIAIVVGIVLVMAARVTSAWEPRFGTNPLTVTATVPHVVLRAADEIGTWLIAIVAHGGRRPAGPSLGGATGGRRATRSTAGCFTGAVAAWLAIVPASLDLVDWRLPGPRRRIGAACSSPPCRCSSPGRWSKPCGGRRPVSSRHRTGSWSGSCWQPGSRCVYTGLVGGLGSLFGKNGPTWFLVATTGAIALIAEPARHHIQRLVDRLVYGARDDPLGVVQRVVDHVGTDTGDDLLPALVISLERELRLDAVAIDLVGTRGLAAGGLGRARDRRTTARCCCVTATTSSVVWSSGGPKARRSGPRDRQILEQLAGPLGLAVSWVRLAADLRRSSVAVVSAREEERRRLRRDLHDGLGPALTGVSLGMRTAMRQLDRSIDSAGNAPPRELLERLADEIDSVVVELKRIVRDLRPTALDQLGLVGALAEFTRKFDGDLEIHLSLPTDGDPLPAAVEVAVYRIVTEAVTNVVRHANAASCWLTMVTGCDRRDRRDRRRCRHRWSGGRTGSG